MTKTAQSLIATAMVGVFTLIIIGLAIFCVSSGGSEDLAMVLLIGSSFPGYCFVMMVSQVFGDG